MMTEEGWKEEEKNFQLTIIRGFDSGIGRKEE